MSEASAVFDPPGVVWVPISTRVTALRRAVLLVVGALAAAGVVVVAALASNWVWLGLPVVVIGVLTGWVLVGRQVTAWGYAEREDDLLIRNGVMFRSLVVVPYGRMQFVDVQAGPLDRALSLAQVQLHTAAAESDARIPGLDPTEAARLRDRLASRGEARLAGL